MKKSKTKFPFVSVKCLDRRTGEMLLSSDVSGGMKGTLQRGIIHHSCTSHSTRAAVPCRAFSNPRAQELSQRTTFHHRALFWCLQQGRYNAKRVTAVFSLLPSPTRCLLPAASAFCSVWCASVWALSREIPQQGDLLHYSLRSHVGYGSHRISASTSRWPECRQCLMSVLLHWNIRNISTGRWHMQIPHFKEHGEKHPSSSKEASSG